MAENEQPLSEEAGDKNARYTAADIKVLRGTEAVRKRPDMYLGRLGERGYLRQLGYVIDHLWAVARHATAEHATVPNTFLTFAIDRETAQLSLDWTAGKERIRPPSELLQAAVLWCGSQNQVDALAVAQAVSTDFRMVASVPGISAEFHSRKGDIALEDIRTISLKERQQCSIQIDLSPDREIFGEINLITPQIEAYIWAVVDRHLGMVLSSDVRS